MVRPSEDDREAIDRAFAEMVAGYHLTADRPDPDPAAAAHRARTRLRCRRSRRQRLGRRAPALPLRRDARRRSAGLRAEPSDGPLRARAACRRCADPASRPCWAGSGSATRSSSCWPAPSASASRPGPAGSPSASFVGGFGILMTRLPAPPARRR